MNKISKINQFKASKQAERKMLAAKKDWHLRRLIQVDSPLYDKLGHEMAIQECEVKMHDLRKFV